MKNALGDTFTLEDGRRVELRPTGRAGPYRAASWVVQVDGSQVARIFRWPGQPFRIAMPDGTQYQSKRTDLRQVAVSAIKRVELEEFTP